MKKWLYLIADFSYGEARIEAALTAAGSQRKGFSAVFCINASHCHIWNGRGLQNLQICLL